MSVNFPTSLDTFTNPAPTDRVDVVSHSGQHTDHNDAVEALEAKVGANKSAVATSLDYKIGKKTDVVGGTVIDNSIVRFNGTTGGSIQGCSILIDDSTNVTGINNITAETGSFTTLNSSGGFVVGGTITVQDLDILGNILGADKIIAVLGSFTTLNSSGGFVTGGITATNGSFTAINTSAGLVVAGVMTALNSSITTDLTVGANMRASKGSFTDLNADTAIVTGKITATNGSFTTANFTKILSTNGSFDSLNNTNGIVASKITATNGSFTSINVTGIVGSGTIQALGMYTSGTCQAAKLNITGSSEVKDMRILGNITSVNLITATGGSYTNLNTGAIVATGVVTAVGGSYTNLNTSGLVGTGAMIFANGSITTNLTVGANMRAAKGSFTDLNVDTGLVCGKIIGSGSFSTLNTSAGLVVGGSFQGVDANLTGNAYGRNIQASQIITFDTEYANNGTSIDWNNGNKQSLVMDGTAKTLTFIGLQGSACANLLLRIHQRIASTITWPLVVKWANGSPIVLSASNGSVDIASFYYNGTYFYGVPTPGFE